MSHSDDTTTVIQNNTVVIINGINANAQALGGLDPLPPNTPYAQVEKAYRAALLAALKSNWSSQFSTAPPFNDQYTIGFLEVTGQLQLGMPAPCALQEIKQQISNWQLVTRDGFSQNIINTIVDDLVNAGGTTAVSTGFEVESASQSTNWLCISTPFAVGSEGGNTTLVGFAFTAATVVSLMAADVAKKAASNGSSKSARSRMEAEALA
jgi:hypothetical protein